ncbi:Telomerase protein component 1 [Puccinia graminis f. sp. tritici]|uniref:Telomerase protein component 1 n=1 Tax=Puccinia graminis f. sp. tritici TaxID=56615 RepID=A0A5B0QLC6_PUCGR|nr:Telomerase protein component 1 [Puccinia graminis f. sp. tritici]
MMPLFVSDIASFLASSDSNMVVIHCKAALPNDPLDPTTKPDPRKALIKTSTAQDASVHTKPISPSDTLPQVVPVPSTSPL